MKEIKNIYVIDDDPIVRFGIKRMLTNIISCNINEFNNGQVAIDTITTNIKNREALPEVIFLDLNMPILDGWGFLKEFISLQIDKKILINIITSSIDSSDQERWQFFKNKTQHHIDFINKPVSIIDLKDLHKEDMVS